MAGRGAQPAVMVLPCDGRMDRLGGKLEAGNWKLEARSWKLEAGSWKLEAGLLHRLLAAFWRVFRAKKPQNGRSNRDTRQFPLTRTRPLRLQAGTKKTTAATPKILAQKQEFRGLGTNVYIRPPVTM